MAQASFPEPKALNILEIGDGRDHMEDRKYTLDNPHPNYGKSENIINQLGHTIYPKMIYPHGISNHGVIVNSAEEEQEKMGGENKAQPTDNKKQGTW